MKNYLQTFAFVAVVSMAGMGIATAGPSGLSVDQLLPHLDLPLDLVAVERNRQIVRKDQRPSAARTFPSSRRSRAKITPTHLQKRTTPHGLLRTRSAAQQNA